MVKSMSQNINYENFEEKLIKLNRVAKVVKGGRRFGFCALMVVGDKNGYVGLGYGKANEVPEAIRKGVENAKKNIIKVNLKKNTIAHKIQTEFGSAKVLLKPAAEGTGIVAGSPVRAVVECAGIRNILSKSLGSSNQINIAKATFEALKNLMDIKSVSERRGKKVSDFLINHTDKNDNETKVELDKETSAKDSNDASAEKE